MAAGTIGLVRGRCPADGLAVGAMAIDARQTACMVTRIARRTMREGARTPATLHMALPTIPRCDEVAWVLARGGDSVVTASTATCRGRVVEVCVEPGYGGVALLAHVAALNVARRLASGRYSVVTSVAARVRCNVIEACPEPRRRSMALLATVR